mgnify:CR=1 FL=1
MSTKTPGGPPAGLSIQPGLRSYLLDLEQVIRNLVKEVAALDGQGTAVATAARPYRERIVIGLPTGNEDDVLVYRSGVWVAVNDPQVAALGVGVEAGADGITLASGGEIRLDGVGNVKVKWNAATSNIEFYVGGVLVTTLP